MQRKVSFLLSDKDCEICHIFRMENKLLWENTKQRKFTDVDIDIGGCVYSSHRAVLASTKGYFYDLYQNFDVFEETNMNNIHIRIPDESKCFGLIMEYIYTKNIEEKVQATNLFSLLVLSKYFRLDDLTKFIENKIRTEADSQAKIEDIITDISRSQFQNIPNFLVEKIAENFSSLSDKESLMGLSVLNIFNIIGNNKLKVNNEIDLVNFILRFGEKNNYNERFYREASKYIEWTMISPEEFNTIDNDMRKIFVNDNIYKHICFSYKNISSFRFAKIHVALNSMNYDKTVRLLNRYSSMNVTFFDNVSNLLTNPKQYKCTLEQPLGVVKIIKFDNKSFGYFSYFQIKIARNSGIRSISLEFSTYDREKVTNKVNGIEDISFIVFRSMLNVRKIIKSLKITFECDPKEYIPKIISTNFSGFWFQNK